MGAHIRHSFGVPSSRKFLNTGCRSMPDAVFSIYFTAQASSGLVHTVSSPVSSNIGFTRGVYVITRKSFCQIFSVLHGLYRPVYRRCIAPERRLQRHYLHRYNHTQQNYRSAGFDFDPALCSLLSCFYAEKNSCSVAPDTIRSAVWTKVILSRSASERNHSLIIPINP